MEERLTTDQVGLGSSPRCCATAHQSSFARRDGSAIALVLRVLTNASPRCCATAHQSSFARRDGSAIALVLRVLTNASPRCCATDNHPMGSTDSFSGRSASGSTPGLGPGSCGFEPHGPDQNKVHRGVAQLGQRAAFGTRRPKVQILPPRPVPAAPAEPGWRRVDGGAIEWKALDILGNSSFARVIPAVFESSGCFEIIFSFFIGPLSSGQDASLGVRRAQVRVLPARPSKYRELIARFQKNTVFSCRIAGSSPAASTIYGRVGKQVKPTLYRPAALDP